MSLRRLLANILLISSVVILPSKSSSELTFENFLDPFEASTDRGRGEGDEGWRERGHGRESTPERGREGKRPRRETQI